MYYEVKIRNRQIRMVVMTCIALVMEIIALIDKCWISDAFGRICQFFHWGFHKIFNGVEAQSTSYEVYKMMSSDEGFRSVNPLLTLEMLIIFAFVTLAVSPLGILIEKAALKGFKHFYGVHTLLFVLSIISWVIVLPVIIMQFIPGSPIALGFSTAGAVVALHVWFYVTLLLYIAMADIYDVTGRNPEYELEHLKMQLVWIRTGQAWVVAAKVFFVLIAFEFLIFWVIFHASRSN